MQYILAMINKQPLFSHVPRTDNLFKNLESYPHQTVQSGLFWCKIINFRLTFSYTQWPKTLMQAVLNTL